MGLAGRKVKQRIGNDPRNLAWSDDAARFGSAYMAKFGWDPSKGLGMEGEGRTSHLKVAQKLDLYGIGAAHQKDPNGIAWKQNKDFERLLERLNAGGADGAPEVEQTKISGFAAATVSKDEALGPAASPPNYQEDSTAVGSEKERKKRKKGEDGESKEERRKRKKSKDTEANVEVSTSTPGDADAIEAILDTKKDKKGKKRSPETTEVNQSDVAVVAIQTTVSTRATGPPRGHRARFIRSKRMALSDSNAMAEVLGIAPTPSSSLLPSATPSTPIESSSGDATPEPSLQLEQLTTSTKSVMDYFKEKLAAKAGLPTASASTSVPQTPPTPASSDESEEREETRIGLGASSRLTAPFAARVDEDTPGRPGLGIPLFARATASLTVEPSTLSAVADDQATVLSSDNKEERRRAKKERKEARRQALEESSTTIPGADHVSTGTGESYEETTIGDKKVKKERRRKERKAQTAQGVPQDLANELVQDRRSKKHKKRHDHS